MPSLFDSETDAPEERKVLKRTLSAQKITFIFDPHFAPGEFYLLQYVGFEEPIVDLFHLSSLFLGRSGNMALFHTCYCSFVGTPYFI